MSTLPITVWFIAWIYLLPSFIMSHHQCRFCKNSFCAHKLRLHYFRHFPLVLMSFLLKPGPDNRKRKILLALPNKCLRYHWWHFYGQSFLHLTLQSPSSLPLSPSSIHMLGSYKFSYFYHLISTFIGCWHIGFSSA